MTERRDSGLNDGVKRREVWAWASYDFANSGYTTVVLTSVFNAYFVGVVAASRDSPTLLWTLAISLSSAMVFLFQPMMGAYADRHASKKRMLAWSTVFCVASTAMLSAAGPGRVEVAIAGMIVSNFFFQAGVALNSAFLPELAKPSAYGRISGLGWSIGYLGGLLTLGVCLVYVSWAEQRGLAPANYVPVTMWIVAILFGVAALPAFIFLRERAQPDTETAITGAMQQWIQSFAKLPAFPDFRRLLWCILFYQAGIYVVILLAGIYAQEVMGFDNKQTIVLMLVVNLTAAAGALAFGYVQDRIGHRMALGLTLVAWMIMILTAAATTSTPAFWVAANIAGLCMGSSQSAGRALVGWLAPENQRGSFYGMWNAAVGVSAIIGPPTYGLVTWLTNDNHRVAILVSGLYFVIGLVILLKVDIQRGRHVALKDPGI